MCDRVTSLESIGTKTLSTSGKHYLDINFTSNTARGAVLVSITHQITTYRPALFYVELAYHTSGNVAKVSNLTSLLTSDTILPVISSDSNHVYVTIPAESWSPPVVIPLGEKVSYTWTWLDSLPS